MAVETAQVEAAQARALQTTEGLSRPMDSFGLGNSLYVGDLHHDVTEAVLFDKFSTAGQVSSIRVCRDAITRRSLGYAYVNYHNPENAERALELMNFEPLNGQPMRIMWSQRDPAVRRSGLGNVFIKNLAPSIDNKVLFDTFSQFGNILSAKVVCDHMTGASKGYGFVHFETQQAADTAISKVNGMTMEKLTVYVAKFVPRNLRQESVKLFTNIFVKNLALEVTDEDLNNIFAGCGKITSAVIMRDKLSNASKGFGFVNFAESQSAEQAVNSLHNKDQGEGREKLYVCRAQKRIERNQVLKQHFEGLKKSFDSKYQGVNLYIKNLDESIEDNELRAQFNDYGVITSAVVMRDDKTKVSKGFGFVCFSAPEEATKAVTEMNGKLVKNKPLYVALAVRKAERAQQQALFRSQFRPPMPQMNPMAPMQNMAYDPRGQMAFFPGYYAQPQARPNYATGGPRGNARTVGAAFPGQVPLGVYPRPGPQLPLMNAGRANPGPRGRQGNYPKSAVMVPQGYVVPNVNMMVNPNAPPRNLNNTRSGASHVLVNNMVRNPSAPVTLIASVPKEAVVQDALLMDGQAPLTAAGLAAAEPSLQKQMLGERLYPLLINRYGNTAAKITGMLLEMDNSELLHLLEDPSALTEKAKEAVGVLSSHDMLNQ